MIDEDKRYLSNSYECCGTVASAPKLDHVVRDEEFYSFNVVTARNSGAYDTVPVVMSKCIIDDENIKYGSRVHFKGQIRTYNKERHLMVYAYAMEVIKDDNANDINKFEGDGFICKDTVYRETPNGRQICDIMIAVNRCYGKSDYMPCIAWGRNAVRSGKFEVSDHVLVEGRFQSRGYHKVTDTGETVKKIAYEVSLSSIEQLIDEIGERE